MVHFKNLYYAHNDEEHSLSFIVVGEPEVQQRPKIAYRNRKIPVYYDPSSKKKEQWQKAFKEFLIENNVVTPVFGSNPLMDSGISLKIHFFLTPPDNDFIKKNGIKVRKDNYHNYPSKKDIDNMLKFCMDAMQDVAYENDHVICKIESGKDFIDIDDATAVPFTQILIKKMM
jgi:Holliday junction resolvase RusA-like endonuclease